MPVERKQKPALNATSPAHAAQEDSLRDPLATPLPEVPLPSRFKPAQFLAASQARGVRPLALKDIDAHLARVDASVDPAERFKHLTELQVALDQFVLRYGRENSRGKAAHELKRWVDGAVALRADAFNKQASPKAAFNPDDGAA